MNRLKNKILKVKPDLKESSIENYITNIKKLSEYLNMKKFNIKYLKDYESIIDFLDNKSEFSLSTKKNYMTSILVVIKTETFDKNVVNAYTEYHKNLSQKQTDIYYDNSMNEKEKDNWISIDEIKTKIDSLRKLINANPHNIIDIFQQYLILNLYTLLPPLRNDYAGDMILLKNDSKSNESCNRIILSKKEMILCEYKTSKTYGKKIIVLPDDLVRILEEWLVLRKQREINSNFLLIKITNYNEKMSKNLLTKYLNKIFYPKKISTTILRKVYLSEKYPVIHTYREMQKDAYIMSHDINTAKLIYSKKIE